MGKKQTIFRQRAFLSVISISSLLTILYFVQLVYNQYNIAPTANTTNTANQILVEPMNTTSTKIPDALKRDIGSSKTKMPQARGSTYTIPVVVHIIHDPAADGYDNPYPDDAGIVEGIEWINNLLAGGPACPGDPASVATEIRLCLATRDINGAPITGINRFPNGLTDMDLCHDDLALKSIPRELGNLFPDTSYLNLYIVRGIRASCQPGDSLAGGYAAYPAAHGTSFDGIVLEAVTWMHHDCNVRKVILHELGHYFNLKHTWEGNSCINGNCLTDGDGVCDTPPDFDINIYPSNPCMQGMPVNTCFSDVNPSDPNNPFFADQSDMTSNLMDYAPPACISVYTAGQAERMIQTLEGPRSSLLESKGCDLPCQTRITLDINWPSSPIIFGSPVTITQNSLGASSYKWSWYDVESSNQDVFYPADSIGKFEVCMEAIGDTPECNATECYVIEVVCAQPVPTISLSDYQVDPNETVWLTHTSPSQSGFSYTWFINGEPHGQGTSIPYTPEVQGSAAIWLQACRLGCCSESEHAYLSVGACPTGKEANHWFFGRDRIHLDWNSGIPVEQPASAARSDEATTAAIDANGSLLFYSNAEWVYNRDHQTMPNGQLITYFTAGGSSTHCITLPQPGSDSLWYLFYPESIKSSDPGRDTITTLYYAIVDMSLEGGLGDVILKDQVILRPTTEKVAAVRHCNGTDWWIVGHEAGTTGSNRFFVWLLTNDGLSMPVISAAGIPKARTEFTKIGEMNISPDGLKIAMSTGSDYELELVPGYTIELFDFDPSNGVVSNPVFIGDFSQGLGSAYGVEFSSSGDFLYAARAAWTKDSLMQYDLRSGNPATIIQSRENIYQSDNPTDDHFGAMLTGPDQKIYILSYNDNYLNVIKSPNVKGIDAQFESHGIDLQRGVCFVGLPTFPAGTNTPGKPFIKGLSTLCDTLIEAKYYIGGNCRYQDYDWQVEGSSSILRTDGDTIWIKPGQPGIDILTVTKHTACGSKHDTFEIQIEPCKIVNTSCNIDFTWSEADTVICQGEDAYLRFYTQAPFVQYTLTSEGTTKTLASPMLVIPTPQADDLVTIHLSTPDGCDTTISVGIHVNPPLEATFLGIDSLVCSGESAQIDLQHLPNHLVEIFSADLGWVITNPTWPLDFGPISIDTTLFIRIRYQQLSCDSIFEWKIRVEDVQPTGMDTIWFCHNDSINYQGNWYYSDTIINEEFARIGCDSLQRTFIIERESLTASFTIQNPCTNGTGVIQVEIQSGMPPYNYSINGSALQSNPIFTGLVEGSYLIEVIDQNGCKFDTSLMLQTGVSIGGVQVQAINPTCDIDNGIIHLHTLTSGIQHSINDGDYLPDTLYTGLSDGYYEIISRYPDGCLDTIETELIQKGTPQFTSITIDSSHCGHSDGSINIVSIEGGSSPYYFQIGNSDFDTTRQFLDLPGGSYLINISDSNSCQNDTLISVPLIPGPSIINISVTPAVCGLPQGSISVEATSGSTLIYQLGNQPPASSPYFTDLPPGAYALIISDQFGCQQETEVIVPDSFTIQELDFIVSPEHCAKENGTIDFILAGSSFNISIAEIPGEIFTQNISNLKSGAYHLTIQDEFFCMLDTIVEVGLVCKIYVPNVFSPNGDGFNDYFGPIIPDNLVSVGSFEVFDRWGNLIFRCNHLDSCSWDGMSMGKVNPSGVYAWRMVYTDSDGENQILTGNVTLIR